jgi:hypothetical protein
MDGTYSNPSPQLFARFPNGAESGGLDGALRCLEIAEGVFDATSHCGPALLAGGHQWHRSSTALISNLRSDDRS